MHRKATIAPIPETLTCRRHAGGRYYSLLAGPSLLSAPQPEDAPRYFESFPAFNGTGLTLALWYRHCDPGEESSCWMALLAAGNGDPELNTSSLCWGVWAHNHGLYFDNRNANPTYLYLLDFMVDRHTITHKVWRHLAMVWDAADDSLAVYLDGELGIKTPWGSKVSEMDCVSAGSRSSGKNVALGHDFQASEGIYGTLDFVM